MNVGIAIFLQDRLDIRIAGIAKLRALTGEPWEAHLIEAGERLIAMFDPNTSVSEFVASASAMGEALSLSDLGWFSVDDLAQYEERINTILKTLVERPKPIKAKKSTRINTELAQQFRKAKILAEPSEGIETHKVVRDFYVSETEQLKADFALRNSRYHVIATLDLRKSTVDLKDACEKAVVLDKAKERFSNEVRRIAIFASAEADEFRPHIEILRDYSDQLYNWLRWEDRIRCTEEITRAAIPPSGLFRA